MRTPPTPPQNSAKPRLFPARVHMDIPYVLSDDIRTHHGKTWYAKFTKAFGPGNTMMVIPANDPSHGLDKFQVGIYYWDYERFANVVDYGTPTYFD